MLPNEYETRGGSSIEFATINRRSFGPDQVSSVRPPASVDQGILVQLRTWSIELSGATWLPPNVRASLLAQATAAARATGADAASRRAVAHGAISSALRIYLPSATRR